MKDQLYQTNTQELILPNIQNLLTLVQSQNTQELIQKLLEILNEVGYNRQDLLLLTFLEAYFYGNKLDIPSQLMSKTREIANAIGRPLTLTYQSIILENQGFTFTSGDTQKHEQLFYKTHVTIETALMSQ